VVWVLVLELADSMTWSLSLAAVEETPEEFEMGQQGWGVSILKVEAVTEMFVEAVAVQDTNVWE